MAYLDITITTQTNLSFVTGQYIQVIHNSGNYMYAQVVSYNSSTGSLTFLPISIIGTGTYSSWTIICSASPGTSGTSGSSGTSGTTGSSGTSGTSGTSGATGSSGTSGTSGVTGSSGTSGTSGATGTSGASGTSGTSGTSGSTPNPNARTETTFTATAGQTTFTVAYTVGQVDVYYNGSKLAPAEFTATTGTSIVLATACQENDIVDVLANITGGGVGGGGTTDYVPRFTGSTTLGNSSLQQVSTGWMQLGDSSVNTSVFEIQGNNGVQLGLYDGYAYNTIQTQNAYAFTILNQIGATSTSLMDYNYITKTLTFQTNGNNTRLNITSSGNVGIGNTNNTYKLDVTGTGYFSGDLTANGVTIGASDIRSSSNVLTLGGTSEVMRITGGNVGIGTSSPSNLLSVGTSSANQGIVLITNSNGATNSRWGIVDPGVNNTAYIGTMVNNDFAFYSYATERMRILNNGSVAINMTTSPYGNVSIKSNNSTPYYGFNLYAANNNNFTYINHTNNVGVIGTEFGTGGTGHTDLTFQAGGSERMRITTGGNVLIGTTNNLGAKLYVDGVIYANGAGGFASATYVVGARNPIWRFGNADAYGISYFQGTAGYGGNDTIGFHFGGSTTTSAGSAFQFIQNGNYIFAGSPVSDRRAKENINDLTFNATEKVMALQSRSYYMKERNNKIKYGFIAQEVHEVLPDLINGDLENDSIVGLDYNGLIPVLVKAIQEQQAQIEELKAKIK